MSANRSMIWVQKGLRHLVHPTPVMPGNTGLVTSEAQTWYSQPFKREVKALPPTSSRFRPGRCVPYATLRRRHEVLRYLVSSAPVVSATRGWSFQKPEIRCLISDKLKTSTCQQTTSRHPRLLLRITAYRSFPQPSFAKVYPKHDTHSL